MNRTVICLFIILAFLGCGMAIPTIAAEPAITAQTAGDVTANDSIGADDALNILKYVVGKKGSLHTVKNAGLMADVDQNGKIDAADALTILQYVVGKVTAFPAPAEPSLTLCTEETDWYTVYQRKLMGQSSFLYPTDNNFGKYYKPIYTTYSFGSAPAMVAYLENLPQHNDMVDWQGLLFPAYLLQLNLHRCLMNYAYNAPQNPSNYTFAALSGQLKDFAGSVPKAVETICNDTTMTLYEQRLALNNYGLLALPFLAERIANGETKWEVCFADQLLGLPTEQRLTIFQLCYQSDGWQGQIPANPMWQAAVFETKTAAALPVDALAFCKANHEDLAILKQWCLANEPTE